LAERRTYFFVGLFITIGVFIGVAGVVWIGATKFFQKGAMYVTYFDESVQGLQVDSVVKYRGVDVGTVKEIGVAPDGRLIEVVMKVDAKGFSVNGVSAKLTMAGITGIVYVELDTVEVGQKVLIPKGFESNHPVIPSAASSIKQIEIGINDILKSIKQIDFKGISDQLIKTAKSLDNLVGGERMNRILASLNAASADLASASSRINGIVNDESIREAIIGAKEAIKEAKSVMEQARIELKNADIGRISGKVDHFMDGTSRKIHAVLTEVQDTADRLKQASDSLEMLTDRLNVDPSSLLFSSPPKRD
jgi:phospholipid/cholesterol/gamma-HCH transport system substrate-binding protein